MSPRELLEAVAVMYKGLSVCKFDDEDANFSWASPLVKFYLRLAGVTNIENSLHMPEALESNWTEEFLDALEKTYAKVPAEHQHMASLRMATVEDFVGICTHAGCSTGGT